ncbi:cytochrome P450 [Leptodontidium sp. MPI-SDFR-AT-0119]|nr:cytochrome P450 [Leptodontidium sp. MPI-SDFR-AT-0119]
MLRRIQTTGYFAATVVYNVYFHPLREFPGPFWWRGTQIPWACHSFRGTLTHRVCELQREYGGAVVRVAPGELHFFRILTGADIYGHRLPNGNGNLKKFTGTRRTELNGTPSILTAADEDVHRRMRRLLSHAFSEKALSAQLSLVNSYVDLLINSLRQRVNQSSGSVIVDVVKWYNYTTFDILGELAFGESFGCLQDDIMHPWITNLFFSVKDGALFKVAKSFPRPIYDWLCSLKPKSGIAAQKEEYEFATKKAKARIQAGDVDRVDFMSYILKYNDERGMTMPEIESNAGLLILAGSETTAAFLSGITYCLLKNPTCYAKLRDIIRSTFDDEASITPLTLGPIEYFTACIEESFRHYPPTPHGGLSRITHPKGSYIDGNFVAGNTIVIIPQLPINMSKDNFADPERYVPERWLKGDQCPETYRGDDRKAMQPFSVGPRNCIGKNLAYTEMRLIFARMLWNFDMELMEDSRGWSDQKIFALWEKKPLNVKLTLRQV